MKFLIHITAAIALLTATPVLAQTDDAVEYSFADGIPDYGVACGPHEADWQSARAGENDLRTVPQQQVEVPEGTRTRIFRCAVGDHTVRINFKFERAGTLKCLDSDDMKLSAWVDGVKIIDRRQWGNIENCLAGVDRQLARVRVDDQLAVTTCDRLISTRRKTPYTAAELKPGQEMEADIDTTNKARVYYILECQASTLTVSAGSHDLPAARTPIGFDLTLDTAPICASTLFSTTDPMSGDEDVVSSGLALSDVKPTDNPFFNRADFSLDVDNDGTPDTLVDHVSGMFVLLPNQFSWISGAAKASHDVTGALLGDDAPHLTQMYESYLPFSPPSSSNVQFFTVDGRIYLYAAASRQFENLILDAEYIDAETAVSPTELGTARRLFELHPDGTATKLCAWTVRKRPEEFL